MTTSDITLEYYNQHTESFIVSTVNVDISDLRNEFLSYIPQKAKILDFGCGSGRDAKYFSEKGFDVDASDGSLEIVRSAEKYLGKSVILLKFQELKETEKYDGIWACASILHLPKAELSKVLQRIERALNPGGVFYTSFKYGTFEGIRNGRYFTFFTDNDFTAFANEHCNLKFIKKWKTTDARPDRPEEEWLNVLMKKD